MSPLLSSPLLSDDALGCHQPCPLSPASPARRPPAGAHLGQPPHHLAHPRHHVQILRASTAPSLLLIRRRKQAATPSQRRPRPRHCCPSAHTDRVTASAPMIASVPVTDNRHDRPGSQTGIPLGSPAVDTAGRHLSKGGAETHADPRFTLSFHANPLQAARSTRRGRGDLGPDFGQYQHGPVALRDLLTAAASRAGRPSHGVTKQGQKMCAMV